MATYLKYHQLERSPFEGAGSDRLVLATEALRRAYAEIKLGLDEGAPRICLGGGPGIGKSSLARALPKLLAQEAHCVLLRDPSRGWVRLKASIIKQLSLEAGQLSRASLVTARRDDRRIVLVIDEAEHLSAETLEHLDVVLGYKDDHGEQLVHGVLLANLEGAPRGHDIPLLWWLDKLTTRQLTLAAIPLSGLRSYIDKHLKKAGAADGSIFEDAAIAAIHRYTGGVPGAVSALCEQLLDKAASRNSPTVTEALVAGVFGDRAETPARSLPEARSLPPAARIPEEQLAEAPLIDHSNTPPPPDDTRSDRALPQFGDRRGARMPPVSPERAAPAEEKLEVQQGLLPVDAEETKSDDYADEPDFFAIPTSESVAAPKQQIRRAIARPITGRGARIARNLITLAILAVIAAAVHAGWSIWTELEANQPVQTTRKARKRIPPSVAHQATQAGIPSLAKLVAPVKEATERATRRLSNETHPIEEPGDGLTSDLRLGAAGAGQQTPDDPSLSIDQLKEIAEKSKAKSTESGSPPDNFEPWTQQGPETAPAAPAPTRSR